MPTRFSHRQLANAAAVTAVLLWGIGPVVGKYVDLPAAALAQYRMWLGAACFTGLVYARGGRMSWSVLRKSAAGGIAFGSNLLMFFAAVKLTTVTSATMISALQPVLVMVVASRRFGETVRVRDIGLAVSSIAGVGLVV